MKQITFLLFGPCSSPGGGSKIIFEHANRLVQSGFKVNIVCPVSLNWLKGSLYYKIQCVYAYFLRKFKIGYDSETNSITFPVWDEHGKLVMVTERSVNTKHFYIPEDVIKPVYLLNFIKKENITTVYVVESQINALTLWSWGYPAIALIGTGSPHQYEVLKKSGIRNYILCFDGDEAGDKGTNRFKKNMSSDVFISTKLIPRGKDVNNLTKEEFDNLPLI